MIFHAVYWIGVAGTFWFWYDAIEPDDSAAAVAVCAFFAISWWVTMPWLAWRILVSKDSDE